MNMVCLHFCELVALRLVNQSPGLAMVPDKMAAAFVKATRRGYQFTVDHPKEAAALLIAANKECADQPGADPRLAGPGQE